MPLTPTSTEELTLPSGKTVSIPKCKPSFERWCAPIADTFGNKAVLNFENEPLFAELVILRILQKEGWQGVWVNSYSHECRDTMLGVGERVALPEPQAKVLADIREKTGRYGGCWDVFAWRDGKYRFVEAKHSGQDEMIDNQFRWLEAALELGLTENDFLICEWDIA